MKRFLKTGKRINRFFHIIILNTILVFGAYASTPVQWDSNTHKDFYADVNGDGIKDLLLQPVDINSSPILVKGKRLNFSTLYLQNESLALPEQLQQINWSTNNAEIVTGQFNDDSFEDVLIIVPANENAYLLTGNQLGLTNFTIFDSNTFEWLSEHKTLQFYTGDFNGDNSTDLLVLSTRNGKHAIYNSHPSGEFSLSQKLNYRAKWGQKKTERLYIADFNGDGKEDIFALAKKRNKKHYVVLADENGQFTKANTTKIKEKFANFDWLANGYSTAIVKGNFSPNRDGSTQTGQLVRKYNANGGISLDGRFIPNEADPLRHEQCKLVFFKIADQQSGVRCTLNDTSSMPTHKQDKTSSLKSLTQATPTPNVSGPSIVPDTPPQAPVSSAGAYPAINQQFTLNWEGVSTATRYELWISYDYGATKENSYQYSSTTTINVAESITGSRFYYVRACNAHGCSGFSPYTSTYIYNKPDIVRHFFTSPTTTLAGGTINLGWQRPDEIIGTGGYYKIKEIRPNGTEVWLPNVSGGQTTNTSVTLNSGEGQYTYKIIGCNKTESYCSAESTFEAKAAVVPNPTAGAAVISNLTYTPVTVPVGKDQTFTFDYANSTWCRNTLGNNYVGLNEQSSDIKSGQYSWSTSRTTPLSFTFDVNCSNKHNGTSFSQHVTTTITANTPPIAYNDSKTVAINTNATVRVLDNDFDSDDHDLTITNYTQPSQGSTTCSSTKCTYTAPTSLASGNTTFTYTIQDGWGGSSTGQVTILITAAQPDPQVQLNNLKYEPQIVTVGEYQTFSFDYINARECISSLGVVYVENTGELKSGRYEWTDIRKVPAEWNFNVTCTNNISESTQSVIGIINPGDNPIAVNDNASILQNAGANIDVLANDSDPNGNPITVTAVTQPVNGTITINAGGESVHYQPSTSFSGSETFTYTVENNVGGSATASVSVEVIEVPGSDLLYYLKFDDNNNIAKDYSLANRQSTITGPIPSNSDSSRTFAQFDSSENHISLGNTLISKQQNATIALWLNVSNMTPSGRRNIFNRPTPSGQSNSPSIQLETNNSIVFAFYDASWHTLFSQQPVSANTWHHLVVTWGSNGMKMYLDGILQSYNSYTGIGEPSNHTDAIGDLATSSGYNYDGKLDNFRAYSRQLSATDISALYNNSEPTGSITIQGNTAVGENLSINNTINDADGLGSFVYVWYKDDNFHSVGSALTVAETDLNSEFYVVATYADNNGTYEQITSPKITIDSTGGSIGSNSPPTATSDEALIVQYAGKVINSLENDSDPDGHSLTITSVTQPSNGQVTIVSDGTALAYSPNGAFTGQDTFTYTISDGWGGASTATISVNVIQDPGNGLLYDFRFDDNNNIAKDSSLANRQSTVTGPILSTTTGTRTYAQFDSTENHISLGNTLISKQPNGTISTWVNISNLNPSGRRNIFNRPTPSGQSNSPSIQLETNNSIVFAFYDASWHTLFSQQPVSANTWHHLVVTWGSNGMKMYLDGILQSYNSYTGIGEPSNHTDAIGDLATSSGYNYDGKLDNFRAYSRQLAAAEIAALTNNNPPQGTVSIQGTSAPGQILTASNTLSDANGLGVMSYFWYKDGILHATGSSYLVASNDIGSQMHIIAAYTDGSGTYEQVSSTTRLIDGVSTVPSLTNLQLTPLNVTVGESQTLSFDYQNVTICFDTNNPTTIYVESTSEISGAYTDTPEAAMEIGSLIKSVTCENQNSTDTRPLNYTVSKLTAPTNLSSTQN